MLQPRPRMSPHPCACRSRITLCAIFLLARLIFVMAGGGTRWEPQQKRPCGVRFGGRRRLSGTASFSRSVYLAEYCTCSREPEQEGIIGSSIIVAPLQGARTKEIMIVNFCGTSTRESEQKKARLDSGAAGWSLSYRGAESLERHVYFCSGSLRGNAIQYSSGTWSQNKRYHACRHREPEQKRMGLLADSMTLTLSFWLPPSGAASCLWPLNRFAFFCSGFLKSRDLARSSSPMTDGSRRPPQESGDLTKEAVALKNFDLPAGHQNERNSGIESPLGRQGASAKKQRGHRK